MAIAKKTKKKPVRSNGRKVNPRERHARANLDAIINKLNFAELEKLAGKIDRRLDELRGHSNRAVKPDMMDDPVVQDWKWVYDQYNASALQKYRGEHIAVVERQILGHAVNPMELEDELTSRLQVDPKRLVIFFVE